MSVTLSIVYQKPNATFATAEDAVADKNSLYPTELVDYIANVKTQLLSTNVMLAPESYSWDQANHRLSITRVVSSQAEYYNIVGPDANTSWANAAPYIQQAGWNYLGTTGTI